MRLLFVFVFFLGLVSCDFNEIKQNLFGKKEDSKSNFSEERKKLKKNLIFLKNEIADCKKSKIYGQVKICLPEIEGMTEQFSNPLIKESAQMFSFDNNVILGVFINKKDLYDLDNIIQNQGLDEYIKVWGLKDTEDLELNNSKFNELKSYIKSQFKNLNWDEVKDKVSKRNSELSTSLSFGKPIVIDFYQPNDNIITQIFITKVSNGTDDNVSVFSLSNVRINNKLIQYSYAKKYTDPSSIDKVKANNDLFGYKIIEANL